MDVTVPRGGAAHDCILQKGLGPSGSSRGWDASRPGAFTIVSAGRTKGGSNGEFDQASPWLVTRGC